MQKWAVILKCQKKKGDNENLLLPFYILFVKAQSCIIEQNVHNASTTAVLFTLRLCCGPVHMTRKLKPMEEKQVDKKMHNCSVVYFLVILGPSVQVVT